MQKSFFKLEVITPLGVIFEDEVYSVRLPGKDGEFGVLDSHASLVTVLNPGLIEIEHKDAHVDQIVVDWGYVEVCEDKTVVLVDDAVIVGGKDQSQIAESINKSKAILKHLNDDGGMSTLIAGKVEEHAKAKL